MTRIREPKTISLLRRAARRDRGDAPMGVRLDRQARAVGYGTWSALLHASESLAILEASRNAASTWMYGSHQAVNPTNGARIAQTASGKHIHLSPGYSMTCFSDGIGELSRQIAISALGTDDDAVYVVHGDGELRRRTSRHRATLGPAMILGDPGSHGCRIEPLSAPWLPQNPGYVRQHVRAIVMAMTGIEGPDAIAQHDIIDAALSLISQGGDVTMQDVLREAGRRHHVPIWSNEDLSPSLRGRAIVPEDFDKRPMTIYATRSDDVWSRLNRMCRMVQAAVLRRHLGHVFVPRRHLVSIYDGPSTWQDQDDLLTTPDLGRSKLTSQMIVGGTRADFDRVLDPFSRTILQSTTQVDLAGEADAGVLRLTLHGPYMETEVRPPSTFNPASSGGRREDADREVFE